MNCLLYFPYIIISRHDGIRKIIMPQLKLLTSKESQLNTLQLFREAAPLIYKTLQDDNGRMGNRIESIMRIERGLV